VSGIDNIVKHAQLPSFLPDDIFYKVQSRFKHAAVIQFSFQVKVSSPKQAAAVFTPPIIFPADILPSSERSDSFLIQSFLYFCI